MQTESTAELTGVICVGLGVQSETATEKGELNEAITIGGWHGGGDHRRLVRGTGTRAERNEESRLCLFQSGKLHGNGQGSVLGLVDHAHAATTELFDDAVVRDG